MASISDVFHALDFFVLLVVLIVRFLHSMIVLVLLLGLLLRVFHEQLRVLYLWAILLEVLPLPLVRVVRRLSIVFFFLHHGCDFVVFKLTVSGVIFGVADWQDVTAVLRVFDLDILFHFARVEVLIVIVLAFSHARI